jgi:glycosyltransferase involved in cell wall biosynthesis
MACRIAGAEKSLLLLLRHMQGTHEIHVACPQGSDLEEEVRLLGSHFSALPNHRHLSRGGMARLAGYVRTSLWLKKAVDACNPDVIHANSVYSAVACLLACYRSRAKLVWHARDFTGSRLMTRVCSWFSARVIAVSRSVAKWLEAQGVKESKIEVIYNGLDPSVGRSCEAGTATKTSRLQNDVFVFANVGQFVPWKRQIFFLAAARRVRPALPDAMFWLLGDDLFGCNAAYKQQLHEYVETHALSDAVVFRGWQEPMSRVWEDVDCLVHTAEREPFGRVVIEAMDAGVPVIAVNARGPAEIIEDNRTGLLVPPGDVEKLTEAMLRIACATGVAERLSAAGRQEVRARFRAEETARRVAGIYASILGT